MDRRLRIPVAVALCLLAAALAVAALPANALGAFHKRGGRVNCVHAASFRAGHGKVPNGRCRRPPAHPAHCANTQLIPSESNLAEIRTATLCLINHARAVHGEAALRPNGRLELAAQRHSDSMGLADYFAHIGPGGQTPLARIRASGYIRHRGVAFEVGENIGFGTLSFSTPQAIVHAWMMSPGHRANILDAHFRDTAIGVSPHPPAELAHGQQGAVYTQDFGVVAAARFARRAGRK